MNCEEIEQRGLIELYVSDRLPEPDREAFERHYFECDRCFAVVETGMRIRNGLVGEPATSSSVERSRFWRVAPTAAVLAAAAVLATLFVLVFEDGAVVDSLAPLGAVTASDLPPYVDARLRNGTVAAAGRDKFEAGMGAYAHQEWDRAVEHLQAAVEIEPTRAVWRFYLGASLLADGRPGGAVPHLKAAATDDIYENEARWLLAKAWLQEGEVEVARSALQRLADSGGERAGDARVLLERVDRALESH